MSESSPAEIDKQARARVGSALNAKWRIDRLVGVGGMGAVYAGTHRNGWRGALKIMHADLARSERTRERFLSEATIANAVDHPGRVAVFDDDVSDRGEPFLVMELLQGETLADRMHRNGKGLGVRETLRIADAVLDLLAACHAARIVHRDVKPSNVFITESGLVKVLDFGVARAEKWDSGERTAHGVALGTAAYMAPEQAMGRDVDGRADLFAVGACIFAALTGHNVHRRDTSANMLVCAATRKARSLAVVAPHLPPELAAFVDKALAFDREDRHVDAVAMRSEGELLLIAFEAGVLHVRNGLLPDGVEPAAFGLADDERTIGIGKYSDPTRRVPSASFSIEVRQELERARTESSTSAVESPSKAATGSPKKRAAGA